MTLSVALYFHTLGGAAGGAERIICSLANALSDRGISVHLITWDCANTTSFYPLDNNVKWHKLGKTIGLIGKLKRIFRLSNMLKKHKIDALVGFVMSGDKTVFLSTKIARVKLVVAERNSPIMYKYRYGIIQRYITFQMLRIADCITVQFQDYVAGYPKCLHKRMIAIPNPVAPSSLRASPKNPNVQGRYTLLSIGRLDNIQKRLNCLIEAFALLKDDHANWDLKIVGDGKSKAAINKLIVDLCIEDRVCVEKTCSSVCEEYAEANLFVIPSLWEGFPNSLAESLSCGLPAVGFENADGVAHLIQNKKTGWLAPGLDNVASLSSTLNTAMSNHLERQRMHNPAVESMRRYMPDEQFNRWFELLHTMIGESA